MNRVFRSFAFVLALTALAPAVLADEAPMRIDINKATVEQIESLPRIGPSVAARVIEYREKSGGFRQVEDLLNVRGIGAKTFELIKDRVTVGEVKKGGAASAAPAAAPGKP